MFEVLPYQVNNPNLDPLDYHLSKILKQLLLGKRFYIDDVVVTEVQD